jgi:hypothetical protein
MLVIDVTYWRTSSLEEGKPSLSQAHFSSSGNFATTVIVLLLLLRDPPFPNMTRLGLLDSKSYATSCGVYRFTILALLLEIAC